MSESVNYHHEVMFILFNTFQVTFSKRVNCHDAAHGIHPPTLTVHCGLHGHRFVTLLHFFVSSCMVYTIRFYSVIQLSSFLPRKTLNICIYKHKLLGWF